MPGLQLLPFLSYQGKTNWVAGGWEAKLSRLLRLWLSAGSRMLYVNTTIWQI